MANKNINGKLKTGCRLEKVGEKESVGSRDLFSRDWKVFVVKRDERSGRLVGKTACCALAPV